MSQLKEVLITLPDYLLEEIDEMAKRENTDRSAIVRDVMKRYLCEKQKRQLREDLIRGYQEMADINLKTAQMCIDADEENLRHYEEKLAECE